MSFEVTANTHAVTGIFIYYLFIGLLYMSSGVLLMACQ